MTFISFTRNPKLTLAALVILALLTGCKKDPTESDPQAAIGNMETLVGNGQKKWRFSQARSYEYYQDLETGETEQYEIPNFEPIDPCGQDDRISFGLNGKIYFYYGHYPCNDNDSLELNYTDSVSGRWRWSDSPKGIWVESDEEGSVFWQIHALSSNRVHFSNAIRDTIDDYLVDVEFGEWTLVQP